MGNILSEEEVRKIVRKHGGDEDIKRLCESHEAFRRQLEHLEKVINRLREDHERIRLKNLERNYQ